MKKISEWWWPLLASVAFLAAALCLIPYPGLQNDELFFAGPLYSPDAAFYNLEIASHRIPLMVMSYTGALKTWLYAGLFQFVEPDRWSVRFPMALVGVASLWLTWFWVRKFWNARAAALTVVLLGTDTIYLMTDIFDWGPVALQHLFLMGGLVAFESRKLRPLAFFLWGVGMWDKALLSWPLIGLGLAAVCVYGKAALLQIRWREAAIGLVAFALGAAPLVWYNVQKHGETASANAKFTVDEFARKAIALRQTADGSSLFGYMVYTDSAPMKRVPVTAIERVAALARGHHVNWMLGGYLVGLLAFLTLLGTPAARPLTFLLITIFVTWVQMAVTRNTGTAAHHTILIWPFPLVFLGIALTEAATRMGRIGNPALGLGIALLAFGNLLNTAEYLRAFAVNGAFGGWTDAIYPLARSVQGNREWIGLVDWGYLNGLRLLEEGDLSLFLIDPAQPDFRESIEPTDRLFIQHTIDKQIFPGVNERLRNAAAALGYDEQVKRVVKDRNGRPVFELFRFHKR